MFEGVRRDGAHLYPAFPYDHFTKLSADDVRALYAFLMTRETVQAEARPNDLTFPFNIRVLIAGWKLLFFERGQFQPSATQTAEWNRGAYLVDGLAHCGACHTPRNALGAEEHDRLFAGGESEGWHAPALNAASPAPTPWSAEQLLTYLRDGFVKQHGVAAGPMQPVINNLRRASEQDVRAIATYLGSILEPATADRQVKVERILVRSHLQTTGSAAPGSANRTGEDTTDSLGFVLYSGGCALCHEPTGQRFSAQGIHLALSKLLTMPDPRNLIHVVHDGIEAPDGAPAAAMPGFGDAFTDQQIVSLVNYLRSNFTDRPAWNDVEGTVRKIRRGEGG
jgi:mono/diheme cytochrome c family protein